MRQALENIGVDGLYTVPVQVEVLQVSQAMEGALAQFSQRVVVKQQGTQAPHMRKRPSRYVVDFVETNVPVDNKNK